jgi:hypothetical protein
MEMIQDRTIAQVPQLLKLWTQARHDVGPRDGATTGRNHYDRTLDRFKSLLTKENDPGAASARRIFEDSGFEFLTDERGKLTKTMPMLNLPDVKAKLLPKHYDLLRASFQHLDMVSDNQDAATDPNNLAIMTARDNIHMDSRAPAAAKLRPEVVEKIRSGELP